MGFTGLQPSSVTFYEYDPAGNRTRKVRQTNAGVVLEEVLDDEGWAPEDRINPLNQVMRRDVTDSLGTTTWRYTWDEDGNMTSKTDGADTWDYSWDEESRLVRVEGPGGLDVAFEYDLMGRMLRRVSGSDVTEFEWDGWDLMRETAPDGNFTRYFCPQGELHRFQRGSDYYSVHVDALGCVRTITDAVGRVVSEFHYGAYGETLETSIDGVSGGFPYGFVGALGCRVDNDVELIYMRNRWYDSALGRFYTRDPIELTGGESRYNYVSNCPIMTTDPLGLKPKEEPLIIWLVKVTTKGGGRGRGNHVDLVKRIYTFEAAVQKILQGHNVMCPHNERLAARLMEEVSKRLGNVEKFMLDKARGAKQYIHFHAWVRTAAGELQKLRFHVFFTMIPGLDSDIMKLVSEGSLGNWEESKVTWEENSRGMQHGTILFEGSLWPPGFYFHGYGRRRLEDLHG